MTIDVDGGYRFARVANNAFWNNVHLDTRCNVNHSCIEDAVAHLNDCRENPTIGLLARKKYRTNNYPEHFRENLLNIYSYDRVRNADKAFKSRFKNLYPETAKMRKFLIASESIVLDSVKPIKKNSERLLFSIINKFRSVR